MVVQINLEGRSLSLPKTVVKRGAVDWNSQAGMIQSSPASSHR